MTLDHTLRSAVEGPRPPPLPRGLCISMRSPPRDDVREPLSCSSSGGSRKRVRCVVEEEAPVDLREDRLVVGWWSDPCGKSPRGVSPPERGVFNRPVAMDGLGAPKLSGCSASDGPS